MQLDLTQGKINKRLLMFAFPLMLGNLLQQFYNIADTLIVGRFLGANALAAVGSSYTLMVFLTSIILGLCMGSSAYFSILYGRKAIDELKNSFFLSFLLIGAVSLILNLLVYLFVDEIMMLLHIPSEIYSMMQSYLLWIFAGMSATFLYNYFANLLRAVGNSMAPLLFLAISAILNILLQSYLLWIFAGMSATFLYNYFANLLRAVGNSMAPLLFLAISAILNILLDLLFVLVFAWGVEGAAIATVLSQYVSGIGIMLYFLIYRKELHIQKQHRRWNKQIMYKLGSFSFYTCLQQSVMNLGILAVQSLVNSFGTVIMAAFAAGVKIDSFAYMPVQDYGNAFSTFIAQNYGAGKKERIQKGIRSSLAAVFCFTTIISILVYTFAKELICIFVAAAETKIVAAGVHYLRIEASFYFGIGLLFLLYGYYRAIELPQMCIFVAAAETKIVAAGVHYLRIEASFYFGIGLLFLLYGYYRAIELPQMSVILTILSLGTRVLLAYVLSATALNVSGIWLAVPIGWVLADIYGILYYWRRCKKQYKST